MAIRSIAEQTDNAEFMVEDTKSKARKTAKKDTKKTAKPSENTKSVWELKADYANYLLDIRTGKEKNTAKLKQLRKQIAQAYNNLNMQSV